MQQDVLKTFNKDFADRSIGCELIFSTAAPSLTAMLAEYKIDNRRILRLVLEFIVRSAKAICPESEDPSQISSAIISASLNPDMDKQIETNNETFSMLLVLKYQ